MLIDPRLESLHNKASLMASYIHKHMLFLYSLVIGLQPEIIVEIGTCDGGSATTFLLALNHVGKGKLYSIDIYDSTRARKRIAKWGLEKYWEYMISDSKAVQWNMPIDILFIDGDHSYEGVKSDFNKYEKYVKNEGFILLHDYMQYPSIRKFVSEIKYPNITLPYECGLTIVRKI